MEPMTDEQIDALLRWQVQRPDTAFTDLIVIALEQPFKLYQKDRELNVALRTQALCRATIQTLKQWQKCGSTPAKS